MSHVLCRALAIVLLAATAAGAFSPYRVLLDPAGLLDPEIRFGPCVREAERIAIPYAYADGFAGTLIVDPNTLRPARIETPPGYQLMVTAQGIVPPGASRSISFDAWESRAGRLVPTTMTFADGATTYRLTLADLSTDTGLAEELFRARIPR